MLPKWHSGKESTCQCRRYGLILGLERFPGMGNGNPLQYSWKEPGSLQSTGLQRVRHDWTCTHVCAHTHTHTHTYTHTCIKHQFSKLWWGSPSTSFKIFQLKPHGLILPCSSYPGFSHRNFFLLPQDVELGSSFLPSDFCISPLRLSASRSRCHEPLWQCGEADRPLLRIF